MALLPFALGYRSGVFTPSVVRISMPTPYAVGPVNAYLIEAEPVTLVDAGINTSEGREALFDGLRAAGVEVGEVRRLLITHAHPDHYGSAHLFQDAGAEVFFPAKEIARVRDRQMLYDTGRLLFEAGMPLELLEEMNEQRKKAPRGGVDHESVIPLHDGDTFTFSSTDGDFEVTALHMPGHTGGHMVFHEALSRTLFAGDQLLPDVSPNPLIEPSLETPGERRRSLKEYLDSLERMAAMDLTLAYPGHGAPVEDPPALITSTIEHHLKRKVEVADRLGDQGRTPYDLSKEMYPNATGPDVFLAVSEVVAHLDLVVEDGGAHAEERDGLTFYRAGPAA